MKSTADPRERNIRIERVERLDLLQDGRAVMDRMLSGTLTQSDIPQVMQGWSAIMAGGFPLAKELFNIGAQFWGQTIPSREQILSSILGNQEAVKKLSSRAMAQWMWDQGDPKGNPDHTPQLNHALYTHNEDGTLNRIQPEDITKHFKPGCEKDWPNLVLTANHADTRDSNAFSGVMKNMSALLRYALPAAAVTLERHPDAADSVAGKTMVVGAIHAEETQSRNGADLIWRINYLRNHHSLKDRISVHPPKGHDYGLDELDHIGPSPAAIRLGKLMLQLMVEEPAMVDVDEGRTFMDMQADEDSAAKKPLVLRADAAAIAKHITLMGYSKGANTISDAVRYLAFELSSRGVNEQPLFAQRDAQGRAVGMKRETIKPILSALGIVGINGPGVPVTEEEKALGITRLRLRNEHDLVAGHFDLATGELPKSTTHDTVHTVNGSTHGLGHLSDDAMGFEETAGYIHKDDTAMDLLHDKLAAKFGIEGPRRMAGHAAKIHPSDESLGVAA